MPGLLPVLRFLGIAQALAATPPRPSCSAIADSARSAAEAHAENDALRLGQNIETHCARNSDALLAAGRALGRSVPASRWAYSPLVEEARRLLARAVALKRDNPIAWFEYARILEKTGGVQVDAQRALQRALDLSRRSKAAVPPSLSAQMHVARARYLESWLDQFRWLRDGTRIGVSTPSCLLLGAFCENFVDPRRFNGELRDAAPIEVDIAAHRREVLEHYDDALSADPADLEAVLGLLRELALGDEWESVVHAAQTAADTIHDAFVVCVASLGRFQTGRYQDADSMFRLALPMLPDSLRRWYDSPPPGLDTIADFWARTRNLWTLSYNEPRLEYWARMTYAILVFSDRDQGTLGPATPMGDALIRYGWPRLITQVERDMRLFDTGAGIYTNPQDQSRGRWVFWTYDFGQPSYIFELRPGATAARYMRESLAEETAERAHRQLPVAIASRIAPMEYRLPAQVVRFRGRTSVETHVAWFSIVPNRVLEVDSAQRENVGLFVFRDTTGLPVVGSHRDTSLALATVPLSYHETLRPGRYIYSLEALASGTAAVARDTLRAPLWFTDSLTVSDLLVAFGVEAPSGARAATWQDLRFSPSRTLTVAPGASLWLVWETYGLRVDSSGNTGYDVSLTLRDTTQHWLPLRLLGRLGIGRTPGASVVGLQWHAQPPPGPDGRVLDYVGLQLPGESVGTFVLSVTVREPASGRVVTTTRGITIAHP